MPPNEVPNTHPPAAASAQTAAAEQSAAWSHCLEGDRDAFQGVIAPHLDELFAAAQRDIRYHVAVGDLGGRDLTAEELAGETLLHGWRDRRSRPRSLGVRAWLLGLQFRVLMRTVRQEQLLRRLISASLEARAPETPIYDDDEGFWEWFQPDEMVRWEDILTMSLIRSRRSRCSSRTFPIFRRWRGRSWCCASFIVSALPRLPLVCGSHGNA